MDEGFLSVVGLLVGVEVIRVMIGLAVVGWVGPNDGLALVGMLVGANDALAVVGTLVGANEGLSLLGGRVGFF